LIGQIQSKPAYPINLFLVRFKHYQACFYYFKAKYQHFQVFSFCRFVGREEGLNGYDHEWGRFVRG
jgi:hypothetical protein